LPQTEIRHTTARPSLAAHDLSVKQRLGVMALNYVPLFHAVLTLWVGLWPWARAGWRIAAAFIVLFIVPAVIGRVIVKGFPLRSTRLKLGSADFMKWWALLNLQMIFCRLPILEEIMRIVPTAYSNWLRLWGSKVGRLVFWTPGTVVVDRSFVEVGDDVLFGMGVQVVPHLMVRGEDGTNEVLLAAVKIGDRAVVGGLSVLGPGSEIAADESTSARLVLHPFKKWEGGRRNKT
jgi:hypothetical protein